MDSAKQEITKWSATFQDLLKQKNLHYTEFDEAVGNFLNFLKTVNAELPGPQQPAVKCYKMRKRNKTDMAVKESNPQRANKADRSCWQEQYQYKVAKYNYYNKRKKVVQNVMNANATMPCPLKVTEIESNFRSFFETENRCRRADYEKCAPMPNLISINIRSDQPGRSDQMGVPS